MMLRRNLIHFAAAAAAALALGASPAQAQVQVSNLSQSVDDFYEVTLAGPEAQAFTTDCGNYNLTAVTVNISGVTDASGNFTLRLFTSSGGLPGSPVPGGLLTGPGNPAVGQNTYTAAGPLPLAPNTRYYVVAQVSSGTGEYNWSTTNSPNQTGSWTMADNEAFSSDTGATWDFDVGVLQMSASATLTSPAVCTAPTPAAVPTLNEWALVLLSILIVGAAFIRRIV